MTTSPHLRLTLAAGALTLACPFLHADERAALMPTVTVEGQARRADKTRLSAASEALPASVGVVEAEDVATINVGRDISNIFRRVPGVVANNLDQGDTGNGFKMRGFATQGTHGADAAVYVDGVPQNMPSSEAGAGHGPAYLEWLTADMIERIEVIKGPISVRHGDQNRSGAVNILTRSGRVPSSAAIALERYGGRRASLLHGATVGQLDALLVAELYRTDGYRAGTSLERDNLLWKLSGSDGTARYSLRLNHYRSQFATSGYLNYERLASGAVARSAPEENMPSGFGEGRRSTLVAQRAPLDGSGLELTAYAERFERLRATAAGPALHNAAIDERNIGGASAAWRMATERSALLVGADLRRDRGDGTRERYRERRPTGTWITNLDLDLLTYGLFAEGQYTPVPGVRLTAGLRHDRFDYDIANRKLPQASTSYRKSVTTPKIGAAWNPAPGLTLYANAAEGFRSAAAQQISPAGPAGPLDAPGGQVNAGIAPSKVRSYDVGAQAAPAPGWTFSGAYFQVRNDDEIVQTGPASFAALGQTTRRGAELETRWASGALDLYASYTRLFEAAFDNPLPNTAKNVSVARHQLKTGLEWRQPLAVGELRYHLDGYLSSGIPYASGTPLAERTVPTHTRYDGRLTWHLRSIQLAAYAVLQPHAIGESFYAAANGLWVAPQPRLQGGLSLRWFY